jgi:signal transduction histidine kinase
MRPVSELGLDPIASTFAAWEARAGGALRATWLLVEGAGWVSRIKEYPLGRHGLRVVTTAPDHQLFPSGSRVLLAILPVAALFIGLGTFFAWGLARRITGPLERLAAESDRIGHLDFSDDTSVETDWAKTERLALAHRKMRALVRESTLGLEQAKTQLESRVEERTRELRAANEELAAFSYAVSHDLRSPLRTINGFCHILEADFGSDWDEAERDLHLRIRANTSRMAKLIDGLLSLGRLSTQLLEEKACDLAEMACEVCAELRAGAPDRDVTVT